MKRFIILVPLILFLSLPWILSSCCNGKSDLSSELGMFVEFSSAKYTLRKIEFIGTKKVVEYHGAGDYATPVPLNPNDTVCNMRIYYSDGTSTTKNGTVEIMYEGIPEYVDNGSSCDNEGLIIKYYTTIGVTTFAKVSIDKTTYNNTYDGPTLKITP